MTTNPIDPSVSGNKNADAQTLPRIVKLCSGGGCCPDVEFMDDGSITLTEDGQKIVMPIHTVERLFDELVKRGYNW